MKVSSIKGSSGLVMEVVDDDGVKDIIREELSKLGIDGSPAQDSKKLGYGAKFLNKTVQGGIAKSVKSKKKAQGDGAKNSPLNSMKAESKKSGSKSPFASSKNRNSTKKKNQAQHQAKVFGRALSECSDTSATLPDSNTVQVPSFLVDACNLLRRNITLEGLFRKAGSSARQNDIKRIVDSGEGLPGSVHPVDVACLIKQFFRCLPEPLMEPSVHTRMLRCQLGLSDGEARVTGLLLSSLLLSVPNQHSLIYFLNFLHEVVSHSSTNRMDAYNLSVVLSPNLLPLTVPLGCSLPPAALQPSTARKGGRAPSGLSITEDNVLAANIDIMQELIVHQERVCRLPRDILAGLVTDRTATALQQAQDAVDAALVHPPPQQSVGATYAKNKKRRSASIHRLMSGLRRVVGVTMQPLQTGAGIPVNTNSPHPLYQHRVMQGHGSPCLPQYRLPSSPLLLCSPLHSPAPLPQGGRYQPPHSLSLHPMGASGVTSPGKRKSDVLARDGGYCGDAHQPNKKARLSVEEDPHNAGVSTGAALPMSYAAAAAATPKLVPPPPLLQKKECVSGVKVHRSYTTRESSFKLSIAGTTAAFPRHPSLAAFLDQAPARLKKGGKADKFNRRSLNTNISGKLAGFGDRWAGKSEKAIRTSAVAIEAGKKKSKASLVLYPYQSVEVKPAPDCSLELEMIDDVADKRSAISAVTRSNSRRKSSMGPGMTQEEVVHLAKGSGGTLTVVEKRPLHKSRSEVLSKTPSAESKENRTPLKASKTDVNLKAQMTEHLGSEGMSSVRCTPNLLSTPTTSSTSDLDTCGGALSGTPGILTPRHSTGRNSKRARRKARNARLALLSGGGGEPDGQASDGGGVVTPAGRGSRGVPDGAECILRESPAVRTPLPMPSPAIATLEHLEDQYDSIKSAVTSMELQIDCDTLNDMKQSSLFGVEIASIVSFNHNQIIQSAYDKMKKESSVLGMSPSENLSRRLDKELKIRRRRSGEGRVMRSPSERKIGTIRRRSKELELKVTRANSMLEKDTKSTRQDITMMTPKLKDPLLLEPLMTPHSLKRGRPNSVRCGLPLVVRNEASPSARSVRNEALNISHGKQLNNSVFYSDESELSRSNCSSTTSLPESVHREGVASSNEKSSHKSSSINSMSSMETSPGSMDDHLLPFLKPGVNMDDCLNPSFDTENELWVTASDFLEQMKEDSSSADSISDGDAVKKREKDGNRPSIAALKKQKKVTENVQLFNQLGAVTPGQRRQSRMMMMQSAVTTPPAEGSLPLSRTAASERRQLQRAPAQRNRAYGRTSLTPRHLATALRHHRPASRVAVVSPLRENWANNAPLPQLLPPGTPTGASSGGSEDNSDVVFKTPGPPPITPLRSRQSRALKVLETLASKSLSRDYYL